MINAEDRIKNYKFNLDDIKKLNINSFSNFRNLFFVLISFLPILPKFAYILKDFLYKVKWYWNQKSKLIIISKSWLNLLIFKI